MVEARYPECRQGDDIGTFAAALASVRKWGGVLEHPAYKTSWRASRAAGAPTHSGWVPADFVGGWTCCVEQGAYGHQSRKRTWLYAVGCLTCRRCGGARPMPTPTPVIPEEDQWSVSADARPARPRPSSETY